MVNSRTGGCGGGGQPDLAAAFQVARNAKCFPGKLVLKQEEEGRKPEEFLDTFQPVGVCAKKWEGNSADWLAASSVHEAANITSGFAKTLGLFHSYSRILGTFLASIFFLK